VRRGIAISIKRHNGVAGTVRRISDSRPPFKVSAARVDRLAFQGFYRLQASGNGSKTVVAKGEGGPTGQSTCVLFQSIRLSHHSSVLLLECSGGWVEGRHADHVANGDPITGTEARLPADPHRRHGEQVYRPRRPKESPLRQCLCAHFYDFIQAYPQKDEKKYGFLKRVVEDVVNKYLDGGDFTKGFAHIYCENCKKSMLLPFSCKGRWFCPSCHEKKVLLFSGC